MLPIFQDISIESLIPQRPPMVMVDVLLYCDRLHTKTAYNVVADGLFIENGCLSAAGLMENMAQTIAARMGYLALYGPEATGVVRVGVIGAIKNFSIEALPPVGSVLTTSVALIEEMGDIILVMARAECGAQTLAHGKMIVSLI